MGKYVCSVCGYVYEQAAGTAWEHLPADWVCPLCGASKEAFIGQGEAAPPAQPQPAAAVEDAADMLQLSPLQLSALCTNLSRGCEKQYKPEESALFTQLADYFKAAAAPAQHADFDRLLALIDQDLNQGYKNANAVSAREKDRGALRALVWGEKVTRILKSLVSRYQRQGDAMLENTGVYVCTICGFIYVGDTLPDICPVCRVPNWKFEKIEGR